MKKIYQVLLVGCLAIFSFFYTNKVIDFIRNTDPIMKTIKKESSSISKSAVNAKIDKNKITPGVSGKVVDYDKSFKKMKKYGTYNESLTVFDEVSPSISIDDYYDKYIQNGSGINNDVSLVFDVLVNDDIDDIINILVDTNTTATFFIDGLWLENNIDLVQTMAEGGFEIEVLSYDNKYNDVYFTSSLDKVKQITNLSGKYCYAKYDNKDVLELCKKLELHTIIPTITTGNYPYRDVKRKLMKGSIISFDATSSTKIELSTVINYIKQKGYVIDTLDNLLSEASSIK